MLALSCSPSTQVKHRQQSTPAVPVPRGSLQWLPFCCSDKTVTKSNSWKEEFVWAYMRYEPIKAEAWPLAAGVATSCGRDRQWRAWPLVVSIAVGRFGSSWEA